MKIWRTIAAAAAAVTISSASAHAQAIGIQGAWGDDTDLGLGARLEWGLNNVFTNQGPFSRTFLITEFNYFFPDCDECSFFELNANVAVPITASTRIFGELESSVTLPLGEGVGGEPAIEWAPHLVFPGLRRGEQSGAYRVVRRSAAPIALASHDLVAFGGAVQSDGHARCVHEHGRGAADAVAELGAAVRREPLGLELEKLSQAQVRRRVLIVRHGMAI